MQPGIFPEPFHKGEPHGQDHELRREKEGLALRCGLIDIIEFRAAREQHSQKETSGSIISRA